MTLLKDIQETILTVINIKILIMSYNFTILVIVDAVGSEPGHRFRRAERQ